MDFRDDVLPEEEDRGHMTIEENNFPDFPGPPRTDLRDTNGVNVQ